LSSSTERANRLSLLTVRMFFDWVWSENIDC
jgi:hypothetical protein